MISSRRTSEPHSGSPSARSLASARGATASVNNMAGPVAQVQSTSTAFARKDGHRASTLHLPPSRRRRDAAPAAPSPNQTDCFQHRRRGSCRNRSPERQRAIRLARMRSARATERRWEVGAVRCHDLRTQAPQFSASARQSTRVKLGRPEDCRSCCSWTGSAQLRSQAAKAAERWLGGGAAFGRLQLHGVMVAAHRSLRITRQSRQPPFRCEAGTCRRLCSLE